MKTPSNNDDYKIVITKPSKYKRSNEWIESSGELSPEEIENIIKCDQLDTESESAETVDKNEYVLFTEKEEKFLSKKLCSNGKIVNITEDDFKKL
ncbi:hypothetical protein ACI51W_03385 [Pseudomonas marginalis]|uniref:hypothetical protein n=1 Tax=Pseudomonas marginalis TaxID=298 RepID=UPI00386ACF80